jgi:DNA-binding CsgD family transcriptional regulator
VVHGGDALLSPAVTRRLIEEFAARAKPPAPDAQRAALLGALTDREREVVTLVAAGLTNDEIAARLVVSPATAKTHVSRAMIKIGARDRAQLVVLAYETGLVRPGWGTIEGAVFTPTQREWLRERLISAAQADPRITGAGVTGSAAGALVCSLDIAELRRAFSVISKALLVEIQRVDASLANSLAGPLSVLAS